MLGDREAVRLDVRGRVAHIILDGPPDNRMNRWFFGEVRRAVDTLKGSRDIGAVLVYGSGRHFSAGADVEDIKRGVVESAGTNIPDASLLFTGIESLDFPVIAAISGFCAGSGLELALACNIRICAVDAILGLPEISWGLMTGCGGSVRLGKLVGKAKAMELLLTGELINAQEAYRLGLVNRLVKRGQAIPCAERLAALFAEADRRSANAFLKNMIIEHELIP